MPFVLQFLVVVDFRRLDREDNADDREWSRCNPLFEQPQQPFANNREFHRNVGINVPSAKTPPEG